MKTLAVLFSNFGPYHVARLNELARRARASEPEWNVAGIELSRRSDVYPWQADLSAAEFKLYTVQQSERASSFPSLTKLLSDINPDAVAISGYSNPSMLRALRWCRKHKRKAILMSDSTERDAPRGWLKERIKKAIVKRFDAALVGGTRQKRYLETLGMASERMFLGFDVVDNDLYSAERIRSLPSPLDRPYFLTVARFVPKKNLLHLIEAYSAYVKNSSTPWDLVICGDGDLRSNIESVLAEEGIEDQVHLPGFLQQDELLPYFAHAGCFILPSLVDQWGLVVNEAMAAGLPVLVSENCGCVDDLLKDGVNGFGFDPLNTAQLVDLMKKMSTSELDPMRAASLELIQQFPLSRFADGLLRAVAE